MIDEIKKAPVAATTDVKHKSNKFSNDNYITKHLTTAERLNMIKGIPNSAFYYLGKVDAWKHWLEADMKISPINSESGKAQVKADNFFINLYSEKFCEEMRWI